MNELAVSLERTQPCVFDMIIMKSYVIIKEQKENFTRARSHRSECVRSRGRGEAFEVGEKGSL